MIDIFEFKNEPLSPEAYERFKKDQIDAAQKLAAIPEAIRLAYRESLRAALGDMTSKEFAEKWNA